MSPSLFLLVSDAAFASMVVAVLLGPRLSVRAKSIAYALLVSLLALLTLTRPLGIGADDYYYEMMAESARILPLSDLLDDYKRDVLYFTILHFVAPLAGVRSLMIIATAVFLLKMFFMGRMVQDKLFTIYAYFCLSYFLQEIIQFRSSMAAMFIIVTIYFLQRSSYLRAIGSAVAAGAVHYVGYAAILFAKAVKPYRALYVTPILIAIISLLGMPGLSISFLARYMPEVIFISRYLEWKNTLFDAGFNSATLILYIAIAVTSKGIAINRTSGVGIVAANLSALSVLLFREVITFAVRLNELFLSIYVLNVGNYHSSRVDLRKMIMVGALAVYYVRLRWIGLISYNPVF